MANRSTRRRREKALAKARRLAQQAVENYRRHPESHEAAARASALVSTVRVMETAIEEDP